VSGKYKTVVCVTCHKRYRTTCLSGDKVRCANCKTVFFLPFGSELEAISWATVGDLDRVKKFATESETVQNPTPLSDAFKRIYELRRWNQQELERNHAEQLRVENLVWEIDKQEALNSSLSEEIYQLEDIVAELKDSIADMLEEKEAAEEAREKRLAERIAEQISRAKIEESKQKSEAESKAIVAWARKASWAELDQFILQGKAKGFPPSTVEQTVDRIVREEFKEIHKELSVFTTEYVLAMSASEFESFVARMFRAFGYRSEVVGGSLDEGIDVSIWLDDSLFGVAQCKRYADKNISASQVRDFIGAYMATDAKKAFFFTTSDFTQAARETAKDFGGLDLYDLNDVKTFVTNARKRIERREKMSIDA